MAVPTPVWHNRALWSVMARGPRVAVRALVRRGLVGGRRRAAHARARRPDRRRARARRAAARRGRHPRARRRAVLRYHDHVFPVRPGTESLPLAELVERQHYRLAYWRVADEELNYRRFFDVGTLVAIRVEDPDVFDATHALVLDLLADGTLDGLRIDHPDGLADPARLPRAAARGQRRRLGRRREDPRGRRGAARRLGHGRHAPATRRCGASSRRSSTRAARRTSAPSCTALTGDPSDGFAGDGRAGQAGDRRRPAVRRGAPPHVAGGGHLPRRPAPARPHVARARGLPRRAARRVRPLPRVRRAGRDPCTPSRSRCCRRPRRTPARACARARRDDGRAASTCCSAARSGSAGRTRGARRDELVVRFQQTCGAVMAKGVEDTAFYRWTHLTALCEVGGAPGAVRADAHRAARVGRRARSTRRRSA